MVRQDGCAGAGEAGHRRQGHREARRRQEESEEGEMSNSFDDWELRGGDVTESKLVSMTAQELDEWKLGLLTSANDLVELLNKEVLQLKEEKKALQKKILDAKIRETESILQSAENSKLLAFIGRDREGESFLNFMRQNIELREKLGLFKEDNK
jgi:hypothetical protein